MHDCILSADRKQWENQSDSRISTTEILLDIIAAKFRIKLSLLSVSELAAQAINDKSGTTKDRLLIE